MSVFKNFWFLIDKKQKLFFFIIIILSLLQAIFELIGIASIIPFVTLLLKPESIKNIDLINNFLDIENLLKYENLIFYFCIIFFSIFLIKNILIIISNHIQYKYIFQIRTKTYLKLLDKILNQNYIFFIHQGISRIFNITFQESNNFALNIVKPLVHLITELMVCISIFILIVLTGFSDGLYLIIPIFLVAGLVLKKINKSIKHWSNLRITNNEYLMVLNYNLVLGIKEILLYNKIKSVLSNFKKPLNILKKIDIKNSVVTTLPKVTLEQSIVLVFILIILSMNYLGKNNETIILTLSFYLAASYRLVPSINKIFVAYQQIKFGKPSIPLINEYYNLKYKKSKISNIDINQYKYKKNIIIEKLFFSFKKKIPVLKDINFNISKNECVGILGESGSGKSTFINILTGLLQPDSGIIKIDDLDLKNHDDILSYQNLFSITSQDTFLINGTIRDNIIFGSHSEKPLEDKINHSLNLSNLNRFIDKLPEGLNTDIGFQIQKLSSGQKQRIAIARAFYLDKQIMIFDEATNALDQENENIIMKNIKKLKSNKTIIIISHNTKLLDDCDKIYEFKNNTVKRIK